MIVFMLQFESPDGPPRQTPQVDPQTDAPDRPFSIITIEFFPQCLLCVTYWLEYLMNIRFYLMNICFFSQML